MLTFRRSLLPSRTGSAIGSAITFADGLAVVVPSSSYARDPCSILSLANSWLGCCFTTATHKRADGLGGISSGPAEIFDRELKKAHRDRAAWLQKKEDPLQVEVAERLLDRLEDCRRAFPVAGVLGGSGGAVLQRLKEDAAESGASFPDTSYIQGEEETLPFQKHSVDLLISNLGLHWVNDLPGAMIQCRQALKPDGLFLSAFWGGDTLQELRIAYALAEQEVEGGLSARISPLAQVRDAGNLLTRAGFSIPSVDTDEIIMHYSNADDLYHHLRSMGESNAVCIRRPRVRQATAKRAAEIYAEKFGNEDGSLPATFQVIYMTGWAPHERQQRAMARGSATKSFEDLQAMIEKQNKGG
ncbi:Arginine-hydroxylase NDUFAF5, mitochondrial [Coccomyxa sp. Obi]|nr:Arginine-hydroxylase NDUFAF5, mitochondrial [Coccomyxa sp. Obi]